MTQKTPVLGGGPIGLTLASRLAAQNQPVAVVDEESTASRAREAGLIAHEPTPETATLSVDRPASTVVVATASDVRNPLLAAAAPRAFDADRTFTLVNDPDKQTAFDDAGIETVCVSKAVAQVTTDSVAVEESTPADRAADTGGRVRLSE
ncbi:hypothetical protein DMJ13_10635 [halophilic archaeon]|nr:hypothetical protein DMJ13_10635 [halophilic archaeon]